MNNPKPGWKTTEFWLTIIAGIVAAAVAGGYLTSGEAQQITDATAQVFAAVTELVTALAPVLAAAVYAWSRAKVKSSGK